jgi:hypothetical protein
VDRNPRGYEKRALLEETDSDEESFPQSTCLPDEKEESKSTDNYDYVQQLDDEDEFQMESTDNYLTIRGQKIQQVQASLGLVHKMY